MKINIKRLLIFVIVVVMITQTLLVVSMESVSADTNTVERIIFDSDMSSDHDDAADLAVLNALADLGECEILACMASSQNGGTALAFNSINTYYGRPDVPCGRRPDCGGPGEYPGIIAAEFPHPLYANYQDPPLCVDLYRQVLAAQPDNSVTIVTTGYLNNLQALMQSGPDQYSTLNGMDLIRQKVKLLSCAGGCYPSGDEFNFRVEPAAADYVINNWPTQAFFDGYDVGQDIYSSWDLENTGTFNPIRRAFEVTFFGAYPTWGQLMVYYAVRPEESQTLWNYNTTGHNNCDSTGHNWWSTETDPTGAQDQGYMIEIQRNPIQDTINTLVMNSGAPRSRGTVAPPNKPGNLRGTAVDGNRIDLQWTDNSWNETGFTIERKINDVFTQIATVGAGVTSYSDSGLSSTANVSYRVKANNSIGSSEYLPVTVYSGWTEYNLTNPSDNTPIYNYYQNNLNWARGGNVCNHLVVNNDSNHGQDLTVNVMVGAQGGYGRYYIYFFYQDQNNWYRVNIGTSGQGLSNYTSKFEKCINGTITQIGTTGEGMNIVNGSRMQDWQLTVSHTGTLQFFTNTNTTGGLLPEPTMHQVLNASDNLSFSSGKIALGTDIGQPVWDNFSFDTSGSVPTPAPTPTETPTPTSSPTPTSAPTPTPGGETKLDGTAFGTGPAYSAGHEYDKAYDGSTITYVDDSNATGGYAGIDLGAGNASTVSKIRFYPRSDWTGRMNGGKFQGSNTSTDSGYTDLYTIPSDPSVGWNEITISNGTAFRYLCYVGPELGYTNVVEVEFYTNDGGPTPTPTPTPTSSPTPTSAPTPTPGGETKLDGTAFGTGPAYSAGHEYDKAYDGSTTTYVDDSNATGGYAGIDLGAGNASTVSKIRFYPRSDWTGRMNGGKFQGSNTSTDSGYTDLYTIPSDPSVGWNEVTISNGTAFRYLRYVGPVLGYTNVVEVEFYTGDGGPTPTPTPMPTSSPTPTSTPTPTPGGETKLDGTAFGTGPAYSAGHEYDKAYDGSTTTYVDDSNSTGGYAGIDLGAGNASTVSKIRFYPRSDWTGRMNGGKFQGSNTSTDSGYTDLYTIPSTPPAGWSEVTISNGTAFRYLRYVGPEWGYTNVVEVEFYTGDGGPTPTTTPTPSPTMTTTPTPTPTTTPDGGGQPTPPGGSYPANLVSIIQPAPHSNISGDTWIAFYCPGAATAATMCWHQPDAQNPDSKGYLKWFSNGVVTVDPSGWCTVLFPADQFPHGPLNIEIAAWNSGGTNLNNYYLQVFNQGGVDWNAGLTETPPGAAGMTLVFQDDFNTMPSISHTGEGATYCSTRAATDVGEDYGDAICADYGGPYDPFFQTGDWMRIQAKYSPDVVDPMGWGRQYTSGMLTSERRDGTGVNPLYGYFECRMMCPDAPGTWPAFWLLNENNHDGHTPENPGSTEYDLIEGYGGFPALYHCASHAWGTPTGYNTYNGPNGGPIDTNLYGGGDIAQTFHTYACRITAENTYFYFDNNLFCTQPTNYYASVEGMYFMINMELGGGWPIDLSRYGNAVDLWVDWVRVYEE